MSGLLSNLPSGMAATIERITKHRDRGEYENALSLIDKVLMKDWDTNQKSTIYLYATLAGLLIDIGSEGGSEESIKKGLAIYEEHLSLFMQTFKKGSIEYNLGNAKSGLFHIQWSKHGFRLIPNSVELLIEAKNHYWRAYKNAPEGMKHEILVNLGNTLRDSGRIAEAIYYYDAVLTENPNFENANSNRAEALMFMYKLSGSFSIQMLRQAMQGYERANKAGNAPPNIQIDRKKKADALRTAIRKEGFDPDDDPHDVEKTSQEAEEHSTYRKFCISESLTLAEHAIYCPCHGASTDNLTIPKSITSIAGNFVPALELRLNRLKSEYSLARLLYYQSDATQQEKWKLPEEDVLFTELFEDEAIGTLFEMLRVSFRICLGILDKIAHGLCDLFDLSDPDEPIAFERFWKPSGKSLSAKQKERWKKINLIENIPLVALYSQATDLSSRSGEWSEFKTWRNALEHEMLVLQKYPVESLDIYKALETTEKLVRVNLDEFKSRTFHLLQFTRSAIINFVFCVRTEGERAANDAGDSPALPVILSPKFTN